MKLTIGVEGFYQAYTDVLVTLDGLCEDTNNFFSPSFIAQTLNSTNFDDVDFTPPYGHLDTYNVMGLLNPFVTPDIIKTEGKIVSPGFKSLIGIGYKTNKEKLHSLYYVIEQLDALRGLGKACTHDLNPEEIRKIDDILKNLPGKRESFRCHSDFNSLLILSKCQS